jgi:hypothetical protein
VSDCQLRAWVQNEWIPALKHRGPAICQCASQPAMQCAVIYVDQVNFRCEGSEIRE